MGCTCDLLGREQPFGIRGRDSALSGARSNLS